MILSAWLIWICPLLAPVDRSAKSTADISISVLASPSGSKERHLEIKDILLSLYHWPTNHPSCLLNAEFDFSLHLCSLSGLVFSYWAPPIYKRTVFKDICLFSVNEAPLDLHKQNSDVTLAIIRINFIFWNSYCNLLLMSKTEEAK